MGNFHRDRGNRDFRGGRDGGRDFGGGKSFGRGPGRPMFKAVCHTCGKECEVPFRPIGDRPIFCKDCFNKDGNTAPRQDRNMFDKPRFDDRRPQFDKGNRDGGRGNGGMKEQFEALNAKLDKILSALGKISSSESVREERVAPIKVKTEKKAVEKSAHLRPELRSREGGSAAGGKGKATSNNKKKVAKKKKK